MPHANQLWMLVGFRLFERLARLAPCIEVFPQATARVMGEGGVHKSKAQGLLAQLAKVASFTGWPAAADVSALAPIGFGSSHDKLDAYLSAWVAALTEDQRIAFGEPPDDAIWVPRTSEVRFDVPVVHRAVSKPQKRSDEAHRPSLHARPCPACGTYTFKRWPWGWDAHAAHKCAGLIGHRAEERKREFRRRFRSLFSG